MKFTETTFNGLYVIEPELIKDVRGTFTRTFCKKEFESINFNKDFVQVNRSFNYKKGTLRGMHYQAPPHAETKLIGCLAGAVFDVAVDLRKDSKTHLKWFGIELSGKNMKMLFIPEGFAHGYVTLEDNTELIYHHTEYFDPLCEKRIHYKDPSISINWPVPIDIISDKDNNTPFLKSI